MNIKINGHSTEGRMQRQLMFKLDQNPNGRGLRCDSSGLFLGRDALLQQDRHGNFEARPVRELQNVFRRVYGDDESNWESRIRSVSLVASALNKSDMARAMMIAVLMRLPDPGGAIRIADVDGVLAKAGFDPDEPRDERGRWTSDGDEGGSSNPSIRDPRIQLADDAMSDAINDPTVEAARHTAALTAQHNSSAAHAQAKPVGAAHEDFWQAVGEKLADRAKALLSEIGRAQVIQSNAGLVMGNAEGNTIIDGLKAYTDYHAQPWIRDGVRVQVPAQAPVVDTSDPLADPFMGRDLFAPSAPLMRPATNADWIDPLINLASLGAAVAGPTFRLAGSIPEALDLVTVPATQSDILIGNSGFRSIDEFTDAVTAKYQALYDEGYSDIMNSVSQGLLPNDPLVIGSKTDLFARTGLRDWLANMQGLDEGPGQIVQVNRRLYDPLGSGNYRVPDVYIPGSRSILDGSLRFKTSSMSQISDYQAFSGGANVIIVRPSAASSDVVAGSYGIVYRGCYGKIPLQRSS